MTKARHGMYVGVRRRLRGETALLQEVPGGFIAQFDGRRHPEAFGWHFFPTSDFVVDPVIDWANDS